jgi:hypothetical protein
MCISPVVHGLRHMTCFVSIQVFQATGAHIKKKILELPQNCRRQTGDMKHVTYCVPRIFIGYRTYVSMAPSVPGISAPLL